MPNLNVIIASTRPGRAGRPIGTWFAECARRHGAFDVRLVDLADIALPMFDEPDLPRLGRYRHQHTKDWSASVGSADAFAFVTPEYNHGYPATLKNAIDFLHSEWTGKAAGFVSYGGVSAGTRAVAQLREVTSAVGLLATVNAVNIPFHSQFFDAEGVLHANEIMEQAANTMLDELARVEVVLRTLRPRLRRAA